MGQGASRGATPNVTAGAVRPVPKGSPHPLEADGFTVVNGHLIVYTDGSSLANGTKGAAAGAGVFFGHAGKARDMNVAERVGGSMQTNNRGELLVSATFTLSFHALLLRREKGEEARLDLQVPRDSRRLTTQSIIIALEKDPYPDMSIEIRTDSQYSIQCECIPALTLLCRPTLTRWEHAVQIPTNVYSLCVRQTDIKASPNGRQAGSRAGGRRPPASRSRTLT